MIVHHLLASSGVYGIERMLLALLPELRRLECDARLILLGRGASGIGELLERRAVPVETVDLGKRAATWRLLQLDRLVSRARPSLVHVHGYKATILGGLVGIRRQIPVVVTFHAEARRAIGVARWVRAEAPVLRRVRAVAAVSVPIQEELKARGVAARKIRVIPNGIEDHRESGTGRPATPSANGPWPVLVCVGRLIEEKNLHLLFQVVAELRRRYPALELRVAGQGPLREALQAQAAELGLEGAARLLGYVDDVPALLAEGDCFVLPSHTEGMPISLLEAMRAGIPIVATRVGSVPTVARDGREAILCPPDDAAALTTALDAVLTSRDLRQRLSLNARRRFMAEYTAPTMAAAYQDFYRAALGGVHPSVA